MVTTENKDPIPRVSIGVGSNKPFSQSTFDKYPPDKYPIHCTLLFSKHYPEIVQEVKSALQIISKESYIFRKTENRYAGITINIYMKDVDAIRPIANILKGKDLNMDAGLHDRKIYPTDLIRMANKAIQGNSLER